MLSALKDVGEGGGRGTERVIIIKGKEKHTCAKSFREQVRFQNAAKESASLTVVGHSRAWEQS